MGFVHVVTPIPYIDYHAFRFWYFGTDHSLIISNVRERLSLIKRAPKSFLWKHGSLRNQWIREFKEQYQVKISNRCRVLGDFEDNAAIDAGWEDVSENTIIGTILTTRGSSTPDITRESRFNVCLWYSFYFEGA
jgi:hypothetical protein